MNYVAVSVLKIDKLLTQVGIKWNFVFITDWRPWLNVIIWFMQCTVKFCTNFNHCFCPCANILLGEWNVFFFFLEDWYIYYPEIKRNPVFKFILTAGKICFNSYDLLYAHMKHALDSHTWLLKDWSQKAYFIYVFHWSVMLLAYA